MTQDCGRVVRVNGSLVEIDGLHRAALLDLVEVGELGLAGEIVAVRDGRATAEIHEYTGGLAPGAPARDILHPLSAPLGPGLLGGVFDGLLRPLADAGAFLNPGRDTADGARDWEFEPRVGRGEFVAEGGVLGLVRERGRFEHRVLVPPGCAGKVDRIVPSGAHDPQQPIAVIGGVEVPLVQLWPVRQGRPFRARLDEPVPLLTGQRVLDLLYPIRLGSTSAVPGGFGTGKTILLQQIAKWCDADVIVYIGCGERGNEMADVLEDIARLADPRTGRLLAERTILIANTSNMPLMAREACIYTGMTVAEYFRDMGYNAVVIADSTSRWAEALREFASRNGQLPAEEGYPASLASSLAAFYERAGRVQTLGGPTGSVTVIASVSPPGGDFTEPVTAQTQRFVRCFWSLDRDLAYARHYPAVSWRDSFSRDADQIAQWHVDNGDTRWPVARARALALFAEADRLEPLVDLVGANALPDRERVTLLGARLLRDGVLEQSALSDNDASSDATKQLALLEMVLGVYDACLALLERSVSATEIEEFDFSTVIRARDTAGPADAAAVEAIAAAVQQQLSAIR